LDDSVVALPYNCAERTVHCLSVVCLQGIPHVCTCSVTEVDHLLGCHVKSLVRFSQCFGGMS
jgi:hypothetical protein